MYIAKIRNVGENIESSSDLAQEIRQITEALTGADRQIKNAIQHILNRDYRTISAIMKCTWEQLGLDEPQYTLEDKSEITGISVEEYKQIAEAAMTDEERRLKAIEDERKAKELAEEEKKAEEAKKAEELAAQAAQ